MVLHAVARRHTRGGGEGGVETKHNLFSTSQNIKKRNKITPPRPAPTEGSAYSYFISACHHHGVLASETVARGGISDLQSNHKPTIKPLITNRSRTPPPHIIVTRSQAHTAAAFQQFAHLQRGPAARTSVDTAYISDDETPRTGTPLEPARHVEKKKKMDAWIRRGRLGDILWHSLACPALSLSLFCATRPSGASQRPRHIFVIKISARGRETAIYYRCSGRSGCCAPPLLGRCC